MKNIEEYYPDADTVCAVVNGYDMLEDMESNGKDDDGYYVVCDEQYMFKDILNRDFLEDDGVVVESYDALLETGIESFAIIDRKDVFYWFAGDEDSEESAVESFNEKYETEFSTAKEIFQYALREENEDGEPDGLAMSLNIVSEGETL